MPQVDLNSDMGEGCPNDAELMDYVSSVNIACGFHAGDPDTMLRTVEVAIRKGMAIGAHPSFPDRANFGRTPMSLSAVEIFDIVEIQVRALIEVCDISGGKLSHVKPHGALYNQAARDPEIAAAIASAVSSIDRNLILFGLSGSCSITEAKKAGLRTASETFADRTYQSDGSLTPRTEPNALITDTAAAAEQALRMATSGTVMSSDGQITNVKADTICIHGDGEHAVQFAIAIRQRLLENGVEIRPIYA